MLRCQLPFMLEHGWMVVYSGEEIIIRNGESKLQAGDTLILRANSATTRQAYHEISRAAHYAQG